MVAQPRVLIFSFLMWQRFYERPREKKIPQATEKVIGFCKGHHIMTFWAHVKGQLALSSPQESISAAAQKWLCVTRLLLQGHMITDPLMSPQWKHLALYCGVTGAKPVYLNFLMDI